MLTIDDPMFSILRLLSSRLQAHNIASGLRLRDGEADELLSREDVRDHASLELFATKVENRWETDDFASEKT